MAKSIGFKFLRYFEFLTISLSTIFSLIALRVKSRIFPELSGISLKKGGTNLFYYILSALLLKMGSISAALLYSVWKMGIGMNSD